MLFISYSTGSKRQLTGYDTTGLKQIKVLLLQYIVKLWNLLLKDPRTMNEFKEGISKFTEVHC